MPNLNPCPLRLHKAPPACDIHHPGRSAAPPVLVPFAKTTDHFWENSARGVTRGAAVTSGRARGMPAWGGVDVATAEIYRVLVVTHGCRQSVLFLGGY